jgi:hypothetical protein
MAKLTASRYIHKTLVKINLSTWEKFFKAYLEGTLVSSISFYIFGYLLLPGFFIFIFQFCDVAKLVMIIHENV